MEIFDPLRKKYVKRTPEEEVRQQIISWLNYEIGVPMTLMMSEYSFIFNGLQFRSDIVIFDKKPEPIMFVECKAPSIKLNKKVVDQIIRYNMVLKVLYILISNGKTSYLCEWNESKGHYEFVKDIPTYNIMLESKEKK
ncbi:MAG: type I restriction enzyme HsdR N-terminal domain-containing protein [Bacteroidales bacterium]|jgi:hypothetical protein